MSKGIDEIQIVMRFQFGTKDKKSFLLLAAALFLTSAVFFILSYFNNLENFLSHKLSLLRELSGERRTAVYLIKSVNTWCHPCPTIEELLIKDVNIYFFVDSDFSDQDITNLKEAVGLPYDCIVQRMGPFIESVYKKCNRGEHRLMWNYLVLFSDTDMGDVEEIRRF